MIEDLSAVRAELAELVTATGIRCHSWYPAAPIPPFAVVGYPDDVEYGQTLGQVDEVYIPITVYVSMADTTRGQLELDALISGPIPRLSGATSERWSSLQVTSCNNIRPETVDNAAAFAAEFNLYLRT